MSIGLESIRPRAPASHTAVSTLAGGRGVGIRCVRVGLVFAAVAVGLCLLSVGKRPVWLFGESGRMAYYARTYSKSVACVAVEYWIKKGEETVHEGLTFGTAFLVDRNGRLLTNRHVACPWLSDGGVDDACEKVREAGGEPEFGYRTWVWFEGARALRKSRYDREDPQLEDMFFSDTAYRTEGGPLSVRTVGVSPRPESTPEASDLVDYDVAVLQVSPAPVGLEPLPLAVARTSLPQRLDPVLALGFPMGIRSMPGQSVNVSATVGHVRRLFQNIIQVDTSLHSGNSGGPVVGADGSVLGLASQVCRDEGVFFSQAQSDMGQVLPIACATGLLAAVASGKALWDGVVDPAMQPKLERLWERARSGDRSGACRLEREMKGTEPGRLMAGAALHYGAGDLDTALTRLNALLTAHPDCAEAAFLRLLLTRNEKAVKMSPEEARLLRLDWRSDREFYGYLGRIVAGQVPLRETQDGWDDPSERALLDLVVGFVCEDRHDYETAEALLQKSVMGLAEASVWQKELACSELEKVQLVRSDLCRSAVERRQYNAAKAAFAKRANAVRRPKDTEDEKQHKFERLCELDGEVGALAIMARLEPLDSQYPIALAFEHAKSGRWGEAAKICGRMKAPCSRESANRLGIGLLRAQFLLLAGCRTESADVMQAYLASTKDPWYRALAGVLSGNLRARDLAKQAAEEPAKQVTLHTALGLMFEARGDAAAAAEHYRQALDSGLSDWYEYNLAKARIEKLRGGCL